MLEFGLIWWPIVLLAAFNDLPLVRVSYILGSPSVFSLFFAVPLVFLATLTTGVRLRSFDRKYLAAAATIGVYCLAAFLLNLVVHQLYAHRESVAFLAFLRGWVLLLWFFVVAWCYRVWAWRIGLDRATALMMRAATLGLALALLMGLLELMAQSGGPAVVRKVYLLSERFLHARENDYFGSFSIRSLAFEPSYLSLPLGFFLPPLLMQVTLKRSAVSYGLVLGLVALSLMSGSRTSVVVTTLEIASYAALTLPNFRSAKSLRRLLLALGAAFVVARGAMPSLLSFEASNISNLERIGSWVAAGRVFWEYPVLGVGFSLAGGFLTSRYPSFFFASYSARTWIQGESSFGGAVFAVPPRFLAELGLVGVTLCGIFVLMLVRALWRARSHAQQRGEQKLLAFSNGMLCLWLGLLVGSFGVDSFVFLGYWIMLGLSLFIIRIDEDAPYQSRHSPRVYD